MKTLTEKSNFMGLEKLYSTFETARVAVLPIPLSENGKESDAPEAILKASRHLPPFDEETKRELHKDLGIATIAPLIFEKKSLQSSIEYIYTATYELLQKQKFLAIIGGSHIIASAAIAAHAKYYPRLSVLHFSARSDLQKTEKINPYTQNSTMRRVLEYL